MVNVQQAKNGIIIEGNIGDNGVRERKVFTFDDPDAQTKAEALIDTAETNELTRVQNLAANARTQITEIFTNK